jgi:glycerophosphoryl diester phosphodiesterase
VFFCRIKRLKIRLRWDAKLKSYYCTNPKFVPPLIAHRGASKLAPENTLAAFQQAKDIGATWVEFDVMLTACGEAVLIHDETLERTTNGSGNVCDYSYSYLKELDAGSWYSSAYANERIPTLQAALLFLAALGLSVNIEIKAIGGQEELVVKKVLNDLKLYWPRTAPQPLISSFSMAILYHVRQQSSDALIGVLIHEWFAGWEKVCEELNCVSVNVNDAIIDVSDIHKIKAMHKMILVYTVNKPERAIQLFSEGVHAVFTDEFQVLLGAL